ncbi:MAG: hypothetical protein ACREYF_06660 [Gammaproteobacteria bacterium]
MLVAAADVGDYELEDDAVFALSATRANQFGILQILDLKFPKPIYAIARLPAIVVPPLAVEIPRSSNYLVSRSVPPTAAAATLR